MTAIVDAMNLSVDARCRVYVNAAGVWHTLNARRITDHCVYFTPAGADASTTIRCEMTQARHALIAKKIVKPGEELECQIGLIMANIHEALAAKGVPDSDAEAAVFKLLKQWHLRNNPLFGIMEMCTSARMGFSLSVGGKSYTFWVYKYRGGYTKLTCKQFDENARDEWQKNSWSMWKAIQKQQPNKNRALEQHVLSSIRGILDMLKVPGDEIDGILRKIKDEYDEHGGYDD